ncbi:MAG: hypothetical protein ABIH20_02680 [Candidatus Diapherotrites archaeon]
MSDWKLFCPKCFTFDVQATFAIGKSKKWNIACKCGYEGVGLEGSKELVDGLKRF